MSLSTGPGPLEIGAPADSQSDAFSSKDPPPRILRSEDLNRKLSGCD